MEALGLFRLDGPATPAPPDRNAPHDQPVEAVAQQHAAFDGLYAELPNDLPGDEKTDVVCTAETVVGDLTEQAALPARCTRGRRAAHPCPPSNNHALEALR